MTTKSSFKIFGYGILLFITTMLVLFVMSVITGSEQPVGFAWAGIIVGIVMALISFWFSLRLKLESFKQRLFVGIIWAIMLAVILLVIAIPNQTTKIFFGNWSTYFIFLGTLIGPLFSKQKSANSPKPDVQ